MSTYGPRSYRAKFASDRKDENLFRLAHAEAVAHAALILGAAEALRDFMRKFKFNIDQIAHMLGLRPKVAQDFIKGRTTMTLSDIATMAVVMDRKPKIVFEEIHLIDPDLDRYKGAIPNTWGPKRPKWLKNKCPSRKSLPAPFPRLYRINEESKGKK